MAKMSQETSWGGVAEWYDKVVAEPDSYQVKVLLPNIVRLAEPEKGKKILDVACGQGFFSHALARAGSDVVGVDISPELIIIAKKKAGRREEFFVSPSEDLSVLGGRRFDSVVCILAIQNMEKMEKTFLEVSKILKSDGRFIMVMNHPSFRIPEKTSWMTDAKTGIQYRRIDEYLSESKKDMEMHPGSDPSLKTISFHRPIQVYSKSLAKAGFTISKIEEWTSHKKSESGPHKSAEDKARREIPLFMCLVCSKSQI